MDSALTIQQAAQATGLSAYTLRYYERIGLIAPIGRASGGQRRYAAADMGWIEFLLRLRATGMPIGQMQEFAQLRGAGDGTVTQRREMLQTHLSELEARIDLLQQSAQALREKIVHYGRIESEQASGSDHAHATLSTRPGKTARDRR